MIHKKLSLTSRILVAFASGALLCVFFLPAWRIDLFAPQYPEGLTMNIWINGLSGDVDVINGLNHYIGMKHITEGMFPEFRYLPYVVGFFLLLGMTVAVIGNRRLLFLYLVLSAIGGALALYDFYSWGYDYGHNLDPKAPIQVPGLSYQPPVIGHKRLLNFDAWSMPDVGGWVVICAGLLAFAVWLVEWWTERKALRVKSAAVLFVGLPLLLSSCQSGPSPMEPGRDACHFCKMSISDTRYGASLLTEKGKEYKFDDLQCLVTWMNEGTVAPGDIKSIWMMNFSNPGEYIAAEKAEYLIHNSLKSPMASQSAAFASAEGAAKVEGTTPADLMSWADLKNRLSKK